MADGVRFRTGRCQKHRESCSPGFGKQSLHLLAIVLHYCSQSREIGQLAFPEGLFLISVGAERDGAI